MNEVLAVLLEEGVPPEDAYSSGEKITLEGEELGLGVKQVG